MTDAEFIDEPVADHEVTIQVIHKTGRVSTFTAFRSTALDLLLMLSTRDLSVQIVWPFSHRLGMTALCLDDVSEATIVAGSHQTSNRLLSDLLS